MVEPNDTGGEAPCFAHLLDEPQPGAEDDRVLAALVRTLADAVVIADPDGTITFWNDAASRLFGWSGDEAIGRTLDIIIPERLRRRHWDGYAKTMETGETSYGDRLLEVPALHRNGNTISIAFTVTLLRDGSGPAPSGIAALIRDDGERRRMKLRLRELEGTSSDA